MARSSAWEHTFPPDPDEKPEKFFHRLSMLAIGSYCYGRKVLPRECFSKRIIEGHQFYAFKQGAEGGGLELFTAVRELTDAFDTKKISRVSFLICSKSTDNAVESLNLNYSFDQQFQTSQISPEESFAQLKEDTYHELNRLIAVANALPPLSQHFPLLFQLRYELKEEEDKENVPPNPSFNAIKVNPTAHQLYGGGANDLTLRLKLRNGEGMDIWYYSLLIDSVSELDSEISGYQRTIADETDANSTFNF